MLLFVCPLAVVFLALMVEFDLLARWANLASTWIIYDQDIELLVTSRAPHLDVIFHPLAGLVGVRKISELVTIPEDEPCQRFGQLRAAL